MLTFAAALLLSPVSTPVELPSSPAPLHGTLLTPEDQTRAAAVIIAGSGPTDRDGNSPIGVTGGVYRQLAEGLAERGVATVRYDKRGIAASTAAAITNAGAEPEAISRAVAEAVGALHRRLDAFDAESR